MKKNCTTCIYHTDDEFCKQWHLKHNVNIEYCNYYKKKKNLVDEFAEWCVIVLILFIAQCFIFTLNSCSDAEIKTYCEHDNYAERTMFIGPINDEPGPTITKAEAKHDQNENAEVVAENEDIVPEEEAAIEEESPITSFTETANHSVLTKQGGVNYYNGMRETWYSSNVLRHYMIDQWHTDDNGVWRDPDGYIIIASSDMPYGTVHETSLGIAKVYDSGCSSGTVDIYVNW